MQSSVLGPFTFHDRPHHSSPDRFSSSQVGFNDNSVLPSPIPGTFHFNFCLYELDRSGYLALVEAHGIWPFRPDISFSIMFSGFICIVVLYVSRFCSLLKLNNIFVIDLSLLVAM